jgi:hypothetical protein
MLPHRLLLRNTRKSSVRQASKFATLRDSRSEKHERNARHEGPNLFALLCDFLGPFRAGLVRVMDEDAIVEREV